MGQAQGGLVFFVLMTGWLGDDRGSSIVVARLTFKACNWGNGLVSGMETDGTV